jgi:hypothetical protein
MVGTASLLDHDRKIAGAEVGRDSIYRSTQRAAYLPTRCDMRQAARSLPDQLASSSSTTSA